MCLFLRWGKALGPLLKSSRWAFCATTWLTVLDTNPPPPFSCPAVAVYLATACWWVIVLAPAVVLCGRYIFSTHLTLRYLKCALSEDMGSIQEFYTKQPGKRTRAKQVIWSYQLIMVHFVWRIGSKQFCQDLTGCEKVNKVVGLTNFEQYVVAWGSLMYLCVAVPQTGNQGIQRGSSLCISRLLGYKYNVHIKERLSSKMSVSMSLSPKT